MHAYSNFIHNHQKLDTTKISFNRQVDIQTVVHPDNEILFDNKN